MHHCYLLDMNSEAQREYNQRLEQRFQVFVQLERDPRLVRLPGELINSPMEVIHILGVNVTDKPFYQIRLCTRHYKKRRSEKRLDGEIMSYFT